MPLFPEQIARNKVILSSIRQLGLTSRKTASVTSVTDSFHQHLLCFNGFSVDKHLETTLHALSFNETSGFWGIAIEGTGISVSNLDLEKINAALQNAIVFVFGLTPAIKQRCAKDNIFIFQNRGLITTDEESETSHLEYRTTQTISPQTIAAILVPQHLVSQVKAEFPGQRIISVKDISQKIITVPWMATDASKKSQATSSTELMKDILDRNHFLKTPVELTGPDFSQGLRDLTAALPEIKEFGVHLTRLVTPAMCQSRKLKIANCEAESVTKSYRQEHQLIKLELTNLSLEQMEFIASHPGISISKNHLKKNCYTVICPAQYRDLLAIVLKDLQQLHSQAAIIQNAFKNYASRKALKIFPDSAFFAVRNDKLMRAQNEMHALVVNQKFVLLQDAAQKAQTIRDEICEMKKLATQVPIAALRALR
jgi:hypothetical protein